jgi:hypothetical protein
MLHRKYGVHGDDSAVFDGAVLRDVDGSGRSGPYAQSGRDDERGGLEDVHHIVEFLPYSSRVVTR